MDFLEKKANIPYLTVARYLLKSHVSFSQMTICSVRRLPDLPYLYLCTVNHKIRDLLDIFNLSHGWHEVCFIQN